ncbi:MAG: hypothetical protein IPK87_00935 [Planctomycetes bacterium]|nr:hypothetical protein [Planctomycetota bacterium]
MADLLFPQTLLEDRMPSDALGFFENTLLNDPDRLIKTHEQLVKGGGPGKRGLGHLTRSGLFMLCAAWERYVELLLIESVDFLASGASNTDELPLDVQKTLGAAVKNDKHELAALKMAGDGWRKLLCELASAKAASLNTPKSGPLDVLFLQFIGLNLLSGKWSAGATVVDQFVTDRGEIAHKGSGAAYIHFQRLVEARDMIYQVVVETDNATVDHLKAVLPSKNVAWKKRGL